MGKDYNIEQGSGLCVWSRSAHLLHSVSASLKAPRARVNPRHLRKVSEHGTTLGSGQSPCQPPSHMAKETQKWRKEEGGREGERGRERERDEERVESTFSRLLAESIPCEPSGEGKYNGDLQDVKGLPHTILTTSPNCSSSSFCYKARGIATRSKDATRGSWPSY